MRAHPCGAMDIYASDLLSLAIDPAWPPMPLLSNPIRHVTPKKSVNLSLYCLFRKQKVSTVIKSANVTLDCQLCILVGLVCPRICSADLDELCCKTRRALSIVACVLNDHPRGRAEERLLFI
jgi:hypothetical protein